MNIKLQKFLFLGTYLRYLMNCSSRVPWVGQAVVIGKVTWSRSNQFSLKANETASDVEMPYSDLYWEFAGSMAGARWNKRRCLRWNDIRGDQGIHAWGVCVRNFMPKKWRVIASFNGVLMFFGYAEEGFLSGSNHGCLPWWNADVFFEYGFVLEHERPTNSVTAILVVNLTWTSFKGAPLVCRWFY